jgi:L-ascorbate metabolism protein UlaG (beta-lactamase superfamily)
MPGVAMQEHMHDLIERIDWLGHASFRVAAEDALIYIDPYQLKEEDEADIVLVTHSHGDHCSPADLAKVVGPETIVIAPQDCAEAIAPLQPAEHRVLVPGMSTEVDTITIDAVPAYNIVKTQFHPKEQRWVGYIITVDDVRLYHAGDTEKIPEMDDIECDIALLPLGRTYTMSGVQEAAAAARAIGAAFVIPMHYGTYEGSSDDAAVFRDLLEDEIQVVIKDVVD